MTISGIGSYQSYQPNPNRDEALHYIGHGQLESSPASTSVLHVISHELDHVAEFKSEAAKTNSDINSLDVKINYEFRNGKMVAVSGETSVAMTSKTENQPKKEHPVEIEDTVSSKIQNYLFKSPEKEEQKKVDLEREGLTLQEKKLKEKLDQIEREIDTTSIRTFYSDPRYQTVFDVKEESRTEELRETKHRIAVQLEEVKNKEFLEKTREMLNKILKVQGGFKDSLIKLGLLQGTSGDRVNLLA